jgi:NADPH-dependent 2,4-dienoyl-CoA reductase/sulfur reductase-like enzyme
MNAMKVDRRDFLRIAGLATASFALPRPIRGAVAAPRVVVIGGGFGGATAAKYIKLWGGNVDVTLVDRAPKHYACILSNLVVTGQLPLSRVTLDYSGLTARGVRFLGGEAAEIDPVAKKVFVQTASGRTALDYDRLILSPGVEFIAPPGNYNADLTPHAWKAGPQTELLRKRLAAVPLRGTVVMTIPPAPYRCPPGPYERACVIADYLKRKKKGARIVVLDANASIIAEPENFGRAFESYRGILEYRPGVAVLSVDSRLRRVTTNQGTFTGSLVNLIPAMKAGQIVHGAGLVNDASGRWAGVDPLTYASSVHPDIHVIGDSQATGQPKSGHMANSQAKVCADAIIRSFSGQAPDPAPVTASACYSPISSTRASWLTVAFRYDPASRAMKRVDPSFGEAREASSENFEQMFKWAENIFADSFK